MDRVCADITVSLYVLDDGQTAVVHSYSTFPEAAARIEWLAGAMRILAELAGEGDAVRFPCGTWHEKAARRAFLDAAKLDPSLPVERRPLFVDDARFGQRVTATPLGDGEYRIASVAVDPADSRPRPRGRRGPHEARRGGGRRSRRDARAIRLRRQP